jgi:hypothetical protein
MATTVQLVSPEHLRGQLTAVFLLCVNLTSWGVGPVLVGVLTQYVFNSPKQLGLSLAILGSASISLAVISLRTSLAPLKLMTSTSRELGLATDVDT